MDEEPKIKDFLICKCDPGDTCHASFYGHTSWCSKFNCCCWDTYLSLSKYSSSSISQKARFLSNKSFNLVYPTTVKGKNKQTKKQKTPLQKPQTKKSNKIPVLFRERPWLAWTKLMSWERDQAQYLWSLPSWNVCKILWFLDLKPADVFQRQSVLKNKQK